MSGFTEPTWNLDAVCICGHEARRHHPRVSAHACACAECACMYFETAPIAADRPVEAQLADAIRCTAHIEDRLLRARYVLTDMGLRGYVVFRRDDRDRYVPVQP